VVNGVLQVEFKSQLGDPNIYLRNDMTPGIHMDDWIIKYRKDGGLQLIRPAAKPSCAEIAQPI
jgi:hypothetical protein